MLPNSKPIIFRHADACISVEVMQSVEKICADDKRIEALRRERGRLSPAVYRKFVGCSNEQITPVYDVCPDGGGGDG